MASRSLWDYSVSVPPKSKNMFVGVIYVLDLDKVMHIQFNNAKSVCTVRFKAKKGQDVTLRMSEEQDVKALYKIYMPLATEETRRVAESMMGN